MEQKTEWEELPSSGISSPVRPPDWIGSLMGIVWVALLISGSVNHAPEVVESLLVIASWISGAVAVVVFYGYRIIRRYKQKSINGRIQRETIDPDRYILYLRSFQHSGNILIPNTLDKSAQRALFGPVWDVEMALSLAYYEKAPVVAVGHVPRSPGAAKIITDDDNWKSVVVSQAKKASCIFIVPENTLGTLWELSYLAKHEELLEKTVFIMPPKPHGFWARLKEYRLGSREQNWESVRKAVSEYKVSLPPYDSRGSVFTLDKHDGVKQSWSGCNLTPEFLQQLFLNITNKQTGEPKQEHKENQNLEMPRAAYNGAEGLWNPLIPVVLGFGMNMLLDSPDFEALLAFTTLSAGMAWLSLGSIYFNVLRDKKQATKKMYFWRRQKTKERRWVIPRVIQEAKRSFWVIMAVFVLRSFVVEPFRIPSGSMIPTFLIGDYILVNKFIYGIRLPVLDEKILEIGSPKRGDLVVFRYPNNPSTEYIKRVVALPGDTIYYQSKTLTINGKLMPLREKGHYNGVGSGIRMSGAIRAQENLSGLKHDVLLNPLAPDYAAGCYSLLSGPITIREGHYFVMGDNRDNSNDSRCWGQMPEENLVGKAFAIWMSWDAGLDRFPPINWSRIGDAVH